MASSSSGSAEVDWTDLPQECLESILRTAGPHATSACALVCRPWARVAATERLWSHFASIDGVYDNQRFRTWRERYNNEAQSKSIWRSGDHTYNEWPAQHSSWITSLKMDASHVVSGSYDRKIIVWDRNTGQWTHIISGHTGQVMCVAVSDKVIASGSRDRKVCTWDMMTERQLTQFEGKMPEVCNGLTLNGHALVAAYTSPNILIWDTRTGDQVNTLSGHAGPVYAVEAHDWMVLSGSVDRSAKLWDVRTGGVLHDFAPPDDDGVTAVALSDTAAVTGDLTGMVRVWDPSTGQQRYVLKGHTDWVRSLSMGRGRVATAGKDEKVLVWEFEESDENPHSVNRKGETVIPPLVDLKVASGSMDMRAVAIDGCDVVAGGKDGILHSWNFMTKDDREWRQYEARNLVHQIR